MNALKDPLYRFPGNYGVEKFLELFSGNCTCSLLASRVNLSPLATQKNVNKLHEKPNTITKKNCLPFFLPLPYDPWMNVKIYPLAVEFFIMMMISSCCYGTTVIFQNICTKPLCDNTTKSWYQSAKACYFSVLSLLLER